jgi:hypothetical protein
LADARRIAIRAQLLDARRPAGLLEVDHEIEDLARWAGLPVTR